MNSRLTGLILKLYKEVTPEGRILLSKLIDEIIKELEKIRKTLKK